MTSFLLLLTVAVVAPAYSQTTEVKTRTRLSVSDGTAVFGQQVTVKAAVTVANGAPAAGVVKFKEVTAGELLGSAPVDAAGVATLMVSSLKPGMRTIRGTFNGSSGQATSSGRVSLVIRREYVVLGADHGSLVIIQDARTRDELFRFEAFPRLTGGVSVFNGSTDVNGDGADDILTTPAAPVAHIKIFDGQGLGVLESALVIGPPGTGLFIAGSR